MLSVFLFNSQPSETFVNFGSIPLNMIECMVEKAGFINSLIVSLEHFAQNRMLWLLL